MCELQGAIMNKYLVVYNFNSGIAELGNVGIFHADSKKEAREKARNQWNTTASLYVIDLEDCKDGWCYYT